MGEQNHYERGPEGYDAPSKRETPHHSANQLQLKSHQRKISDPKKEIGPGAKPYGRACFPDLRGGYKW